MNIIWKQKLGPEDKPYLIRWVLDLWIFSIRIHHWMCSDDSRAYHDHAWCFLTFVLRGGYTDVSPNGSDFVSAGMFRFRRAKHPHWVKVDNPAWTIMLTGPPLRRWGFHTENGWKSRNRYFFKYGHHQCD